ncbi:MAG TPA: amidohydrolase family protein, partial [Rectinemataceae bacterium]|nr:amidohydrolase family protein [Rectinemataceae bacterium]
MIDLFVKNAKAVDGTGVSEENLCIDKGRIVGRVSRSFQVEARTVVDAEGRFVVPGAVDSHCHIGQLPGTGHFRPQATKAENFRTESASSLYGGTTTALNYMFSENSYETTIGDYLKWVKESSAIDMKLHGGLLCQLHIDNLPIYIKKLGLTSFKIFLPYKGEEAHKLGGLNSLTDGQVLEAFAILKRFNALPIVHCENPDLIDYFMARNQRDSDQSLAAWESTRPAIVESESAHKILYFSTKIGNRVAIAHVSAADTVDVIERYRSIGPVLETCPHYLALSNDMDLGSLGKVSPPIRSRRDQNRLWEAIAEYPSVMIGSDHNAWLRQHKSELWNGFAGLPDNAFILPVLFTEGFDKRRLPVSRIVQVSSTNPARQAGLYPRKGSLSVGSDADIV